MCGGVFDHYSPSLQHSSWSSANSSSDSQWHIDRKPPRKITVKSKPNYSLLKSRNSSRIISHISTSDSGTRGETSPKPATGEPQDVAKDCCKVVKLNMPMETSVQPHSYSLKCHIKRTKGV